MRELLYAADGHDETRVRRAFGWVVTFRDFPTGSYQTVDGDSMMTEALTLFTKGRAEFYLDGVRRGDRTPGILSSEHDVVGQGGTFELRYIEPTTRVCIPNVLNRGKQPDVKKLVLQAGEKLSVKSGFKALVCLGEVRVESKVFNEEQTIYVVSDEVTIEATKYSMLLDFSYSHAPR